MKCQLEGEIKEGKILKMNLPLQTKKKLKIPINPLKRDLSARLGLLEPKLLRNLILCSKDQRDRQTKYFQIIWVCGRSI